MSRAFFIALSACGCLCGVTGCEGDSRPAASPSSTELNQANAPPQQAPAAPPARVQEHVAEESAPKTTGIGSNTPPTTTLTSADLDLDSPGPGATAMDQGTGASDRNSTAAIRRAVVSDPSLSFKAKNVLIVTNGGKVTLRGTVENATEKASVVSKAKQAPGVSAVDDKLEIKK